MIAHTASAALATFNTANLEEKKEKPRDDYLDLLEFIMEVRGRGKGKELRWRYHGTAFSRDGNSRRYRRLAFRGRI